MTIRAEVYLECDGCGESDTHDLAIDESADDLIDREGWFKTGTLLDRLLCDACYEEEGD